MSSTIVKHLTKAQTAAKKDGRFWIKKEIGGLIRRINVAGGGVTTPKPAGLKSSENNNVGIYPSDDAFAPLLGNSKKKNAAAVANVREGVASQANQAMIAELKGMLPDELRAQFGTLPKAKKFIKDNGGKIKANATWDQTLSVLYAFLHQNDEEE